MRHKEMKKRLLRFALRILGALAGLIFTLWIVVSQPSFYNNSASALTGRPENLRAHVDKLSQQFHPRNWQNRDNLDKCADYIAEQFIMAGAAVEFQPFSVNGKQYRNVIGRFNVTNASRVVVGAHYDSCDDTPGADDNASGVAALIELAHLLGLNAVTGGVELVAYVLEEPPFFRTESMGSAVHAKSIAADRAAVRGVIVLEMVGCFKDERRSQSYPSLLLRLMYPSRGNFIAVASRFDQGDWIKRVKTGMKGATDLPVYSIRAPAIVPGIDFSDHMNYWPYDIKAVMVTDTAFYRNKAYHTDGDTADKLDYNRMAKVVVAVFEAVRDM
jgi:hypothetical protein